MSKKLTKEEVISRFIEKHGHKYDYSKVEYASIDEKVCIICPKHGEFWQSPYRHIKESSCPKCSREQVAKKQALGVARFIEKARQVHGDKYDYSKVKYENNSTKVCIICKEHGEFWQSPDKHLEGQGCPKCKCEKIRNARTLSIDEFIDRARQIHGDIFDFSLVNYESSHKEVTLICKKCGHKFNILPNKLLCGFGCKFCNETKLELATRRELEKNKVEFVKEKTFTFLGSKRVDFYLPNTKTVIECQGVQHFQSVEYFGGEKCHLEQLERDRNKKKELEANGIKVFYIVNDDVDLISLPKMYTKDNTFHVSLLNEVVTKCI